MPPKKTDDFPEVTLTIVADDDAREVLNELKAIGRSKQIRLIFGVVGFFLGFLLGVLL